MPTKLETHISKSIRQAPSQTIGEKLSALVMARLTRRQRTTQRTLTQQRDPFQLTPEQRMMHGTSLPATGSSTATRRRARRIGRNKAYMPTSKVDVSRLGTFRHYMIATIRKHHSTRAAELEHQGCTDPKFAKNRLDFNWAADNGFIEWL